MKTISTAVQAFFADEDGVTAIEYALLAAVLGVGVAVAAGALKTGIASAFTNIVNRLATAVGGN